MRLAILLLACTVIAGCFSRNEKDDCTGVREYQASHSIPPFSAPEGLDEPAAPERFAIPELPADTPTVPPGCLDRPPDYFNRPLRNTDEAAGSSGAESAEEGPTP